MQSFLELPAEVRQRIYRYLYVPLEVSISSQEIEMRRSSIKAHVLFIYPHPRCGQFLRTNRTILTEASSVFYATTTFILDVFRPWWMLNGTNTYDRIPSLAKLCHIKLRLEPKHLTDIPALVHIEGGKLKSIKSFSIMLSAVEWYQSVHVAHGGMFRSKLTYDDAYRKLRTIAMELLLSTGLDKLEDKSAPGYKVWFKLSTIHRTAPELATVSQFPVLLFL